MTIEPFPCSACGAKPGERCGVCARELMCGEVSEVCDREGCDRLVMARKYARPRRQLNPPPPTRWWGLR